MKQNIDKFLGYFLILLMALITFDVLWGVFTRYALGSQAGWSEELARFLLIWIGMLGAAYAAGQKMHLAIDLLKPKLNQWGQRSLHFAVHFSIIAFALTVMVAGGLRLMYVTYVLGQLSPALRIPMAAVYAAIPLSGALVFFYEISVIKWKSLSSSSPSSS